MAQDKYSFQKGALEDMAAEAVVGPKGADSGLVWVRRLFGAVESAGSHVCMNPDSLLVARNRILTGSTQA